MAQQVFEFLINASVVICRYITYAFCVHYNCLRKIKSCVLWRQVKREPQSEFEDYEVTRLQDSFFESD